jgi:hypothetical protein
MQYKNNFVVSMAHSLTQPLVNETNKTFDFCESKTGCIWCSFNYIEHHMEQTNRYVNAEGNKTSAVKVQTACTPNRT